MTVLSEPEHGERSLRHAAVGDTLASHSEHGWAAVCYFYAAYHLVLGALQSDPVFSDPTRLSRIHPELTMQDRTTSRHHPRRTTANGREWGVNELVGLLYGAPVLRVYDRLHRASIAVRYVDGLPSDAPDFRPELDKIVAFAAAGDLLCKLHIAGV